MAGRRQEASGDRRGQGTSGVPEGGPGALEGSGGQRGAPGEGGGLRK